MNKDNSHSWVRISHGLNKLVTDLIDKEYDDNEQETSTTKTEVFTFASRSKAEAKPRRPSTTCSSSRTIHIIERTWIDIEPEARFDQAYPVAKRLDTLLLHGELLREEDALLHGELLREEDGAIEFWRQKEYLRHDLSRSQHWSDEMWKSKMAGSELFNINQDAVPTILPLQDNVLIPNDFF